MDAIQPGVDVDLDGLRMVADRLRADTEKAWRPGTIRAGLELDHGIRFGLAVPGGQIAAAGELFRLVLERALRNTASQLEAAESLAAAIETVLAAGARTDAGIDTGIDTVAEPGLQQRVQPEPEPGEGWAEGLTEGWAVA